MEQVLSTWNSVWSAFPFEWVAILAVFALLHWLYEVKVEVPQEVAKRWAETKVRKSAPISEKDIKALARKNSHLLDDALALRYAQTEEGRNSA